VVSQLILRVQAGFSWALLPVPKSPQNSKEGDHPAVWENVHDLGRRTRPANRIKTFDHLLEWVQCKTKIRRLNTEFDTLIWFDTLIG